MIGNICYLEDFGSREKDIAVGIIRASDSVKGQEQLKGHKGLEINFNSKSGQVYLMDDEFNIWVLVGDELEKMHYCLDCGDEFTESDLESGNDSVHLICGKSGEENVIHLEDPA